ncbi:MAG: sigma-54-dependent Fis family transcriptional regulator [Pseudomonadota bacterium]
MLTLNVLSHLNKIVALIAFSSHPHWVLSPSCIKMLLLPLCQVVPSCTGTNRQYCGVGRDWSERASGTNAIGTALVAGSPTMVRSVEHFVAAAKIWDCSAAPIRDLSDGSCIGVLDVTSVGDLSDSHTLALAVTAAHQIEHTLHAQELARSVQLLNWYRSVPRRWHGASALLIDRKGRIVRGNEFANEVGAFFFSALQITDDGPAFPSDIPARVTATLPYEPPADFHHGAKLGWQGGVIMVDASALPSDNAARLPTVAIDLAFAAIVTSDPDMLNVIRKAGRIARADSVVLLNGETGSGKELFARAIHNASAVSAGPFIAVNCGTLTRELAASELLGYEAGAFTGASNKGRRGKFEEADGGTLFLDEIAELPVDVQVHLLRVLQDKVVVRVGGNTERAVKVRIIAATHRDLERDVETGRFRSDLLFRLRVLALLIPPLRARSGDIPLLVERHLRHLAATYGLGSKQASDELLAHLARHPWPGNVRELNALIENLYILTDGPLLSPLDLPSGFLAAAELPRPAPPFVPLERGESRNKETVEAAIVSCGYNMSAAAQQLGISRSTLYRRMKALGIERPSQG